MKKEFTLENFFVYDGNRVAFLAAQKIIQFPGEIFNPYYVYSNTGLGKTHLLWAVYNELVKKHPAAFFSGRDFEKHLETTADFTTLVIADDIFKLQEKYDTALLDFIDAYMKGGKQLCFSGNVAPRDLKNLSPRIISRIEGGLVCDIQPPKEMALTDIIRKKSAEFGVIVPDDIVLELAQISGGSFRTIEGMLKRLVAYASLGNLNFDVANIRLILKEFYPKGLSGSVPSLLEELKKNATEVLQEVTEKIDRREEYKERKYIWEMKGFDTTALDPLMDGDIDNLSAAYNEFIRKVEKLVELQKAYGAINTAAFPDEAMKIETMLFSPDKIGEIEELIDRMRVPAPVEEPDKSFATFIVGQCNQVAESFYRENVLPNIGAKYNPFIIVGARGCGKTHLLRAIEKDLRARGRRTYFQSLSTSFDLDPAQLPACEVLIVDDLSSMREAPEAARSYLARTIMEFVRAEKEVIISSDRGGDDEAYRQYEKTIFDLGMEVQLQPPSADVAEKIIRARKSPEEAAALLGGGLPVFVSFEALVQFIESGPEPVPEEKESVIEEPLVSLGLPGEEAAEEAAEPTGEAPAVPAVSAEETAPAVEEAGPKEEPAVPVAEAVPEVQLKPVRVERLIVSEISGELIEENY